MVFAPFGETRRARRGGARASSCSLLTTLDGQASRSVDAARRAGLFFRHRPALAARPQNGSVPRSQEQARALRARRAGTRSYPSAAPLLTEAPKMQLSLTETRPRVDPRWPFFWPSCLRRSAQTTSVCSSLPPVHTARSADRARPLDDISSLPSAAALEASTIASFDAEFPTGCSRSRSPRAMPGEGLTVSIDNQLFTVKKHEPLRCVSIRSSGGRLRPFAATTRGCGSPRAKRTSRDGSSPIG